ncbi:50S ribosomal protein L11 methyltransferase [Parasulfitobacter algicola]|uniref:Ribosomal protein L11 methyltransferase n=1 Tax=Parasulfitobacter algicola TaxID=2614809 RepID=A0ABX2IMW1_9RHOB|nr:50S ribosomal protein L11 methyltransferase [Sulfitobacter algicola]NSX54227.1 50S ribosomal protein L11 methyltransferase [Sulfitobacter algicola]
MTTFTALTTLAGKDQAEALGEAMERLVPEPSGVGVFEIEDGSGLWEVGGYFIEEPDTAGLAVLATAFNAKPFTVSQLPEVDWVAKVRRELAPVEAGRFFVYGSHDADKVPADKVPLLIEASMAFGTGHHGTTLGCLQALDFLIESGVTARNVIDVGCGTAVLAMAAAHIWPHDVIASDIDPVAVEVAQVNAQANNLADRVTCLEAVGFDHPDIKAKAPFDLIFANILKSPLIHLLRDMKDHSQPGGYLILSGLLTDQTQEVISIYTENGYNLVRTDNIGDWSALIMRKNG